MDQEWYYKSISLDILRFSSLLADLNQNTKAHKSINQMLFTINMSEHEYISEVRHQIAHKQIPPPLIIEKSLDYLICYLHDNYWLK